MRYTPLSNIDWPARIRETRERTPPTDAEITARTRQLFPNEQPFISQAELGARCDPARTKTAIARLETPGNAPTNATLVDVFDAMGCRIDVRVVRER